MDISNYTLVGRNYHSVDTYFSRDLINRFTQLNEDGSLLYNVPLGGILDQSYSSVTNHSARAQLNMNKKIGENHELSGMLGAEIRQTTTDGSTGRTYGYNDDVLTFVPVDHVTLFDSYNDVYGTGRIESNTDFIGLLDRSVSFYANAAYTYRQRYSFYGSARKDASNLFGVETNKKGVPLWSLGTAWTLSEEPFYNLSFLPHVKVKMTYGFSGNVPTEQSAATILTYYPASNSQFNIPYAIVQTPANPTLRWEKVGMFNAGVDFATKGNRLSGSVEYFIKDIRDMLGTQNMDLTKGFFSMLTNSANMRGKGIDLALSEVDHWGKFRWNKTLLFSYVKNELKKYLAEPSDLARTYIGNATSILPIVGQMPYQLASIHGQA